MRGESFEKINDLYLWNAVWMMFVTSTTVGYGDLDATTNFGRVVASAMSVVGIVLVALLTAALSTALQWSEEELSSLLVMKREKAKQQLVHLAALTIQRRVRMRQDLGCAGIRASARPWTDAGDYAESTQGSEGGRQTGRGQLRG